MKLKVTFLMAGILIASATKAQWAIESSGFATSGLSINSISIVNSNEVWATAYDTAFATPVNMYTKTLNGGTTWATGTISAASGLDFTSVWATAHDTAWVSMIDATNGGGFIYKTTDGGTSWNQQTTAAFVAPGGWADFIYMFDRNNGVCVGDSNGGYWEIYTTINGGTNCSVVGNTVWFGTTSGRVYKSTNKGATWIAAATSLTNCVNVVFKDANNGIATDGTAIVTSTNGGLTWTNLAFTGNFWGNGLCYVPGTTGTYISTGWGSGNNGSSYSVNDGASWVNIDVLQHDFVSFLNPTTGWSGGINSNATTGGMFKWAGVFTGIKNSEFANANGIINYPNPFTNQTTFEVISEKNGTHNFKLEIFDLLGKSILLRNDFLGNKINIGRNEMESGVYFYKIYDCDSVIGTGRLIAQ
jgi:hypothetical protein